MYVDIFVTNRKTRKVETYRLCQDLNIDFDYLIGAYIFQFLHNKKRLSFDTQHYIITID